MHVVPRGRTVVLAAVVALLLGCSSSGGESRARAELVYESVVRWFAQRSATDPDPLPVFVEPRGEGASIQFDVQVKVVDGTKDVAKVKFIDSREEALVTNSDGTVVVADGGVLLRLDPVIEHGNTVKLDVDVHDHDDVFRTLEFDLTRSDGNWTISKTPVEIPSS